MHYFLRSRVVWLCSSVFGKEGSVGVVGKKSRFILLWVKKNIEKAKDGGKRKDRTMVITMAKLRKHAWRTQAAWANKFSIQSKSINK